METYISIKLQHKKETQSAVEAFFDTIETGDKLKIQASCEPLGEHAVNGITVILEDSIYSEYLEHLNVDRKKTSIEIDGTCGSGGFEFVIELVKLLGPVCKKISASYEHDEEPPDEGDWPLKIEFKHGSILINGDEYESSTPEDEESEPYKEAEFELIGPQLTDETLAELRKVCANLLSIEGADIKHYTDTFIKICHVLVALENEHHSGLEMDVSNEEDFRDLYTQRGSIIKQSPVREYLYEYYRTVISRINAENHLGTIIKRFDEAFYFTSVLIEVLGDKEVRTFFTKAIGSLEDFYVWKDYIMLMMEGLDDDE